MKFFNLFNRKSKRIEELESQLRDTNVKLYTESNKEMVNFLSQSTEGYWGYWDWYIDFSIPIEENYEYMSPRFWEIFGYSPEEKSHRVGEWMDMIHKEDGDVAMNNFNKHVETKGEHPYRQIVRYTHKDGSTVWVLCKGKVIEWADGVPTRMIGTHTDITSEMRNK
ncbi:MAG: putative bacteriophytochrome [uncultured marine phage]|uniref:histidine kinase n=1 Tax=uncultured marine phage TaxID=707152 RepID=A0A8D9CBR8_9VIRU|nr:MAG: putative bacteriophytochrome [uncultured marine phage]